MLGLILAAASTAIGIGKDLAASSGAKKQAEAIKKAAIAARNESFRQVSLNEAQQQDAAAQTVSQIDAQARNADALARVSAGESGVAGASVEALIGDIGRQASNAKMNTKRNLEMAIAQAQEQKRAIAVDAQNRINTANASVPSALETGLSIASRGIDFGNFFIKHKSPS